MSNLLAHRGPDDHGEEIYQIQGGKYVGFAHRRLSILDLSDKGHQPMHSKDRRISVVFNGEIYNYGELKRQSIYLGYSLSGASSLIRSVAFSHILTLSCSLISSASHTACNELIRKSAGEYADRVIYAGRLVREQLYPLIKGAEVCLLPSS